MAKKTNYESIASMEDLDHIRKRPGMYVGSVNSDDGEMPEALVQILQETLSNAIDEALVGYGDEISVTIHEDNSVTVSDHGRGIPMGKDFDDVIRSFTVLNSSGKFDSTAYAVSGGVHGVGNKATNALSVYLHAEVVRDDVAYDIKFAQKDIVSKSHRKPKRGEKTGTSITFLPDDTVFDSIVWDSDVIDRKIKSQSYLTPQVTYHFTDERADNPETITYHHPGGIEDLVSHTSQGLSLVGTTKPVTFTDKAFFQDKKFIGLEDTVENTDDLTEVGVNISMVFTEDLQDTTIAYTNGIPNKGFGYHVDGAWQALHKIINNFAKQNKLVKTGEKLQPADTREGMVMVVSVTMPESIMSFKGQTKDQLRTVQAKAATEAAMEKHFGLWMVEHTKQATQIVKQVVDSMAARKAAAEARQATKTSRKRNSKAAKLEISTKLTPASTHAPPEYRELFITEGDSAGGSVVSARVPEVVKGKKVLTQGVLPIRGKIMNTYGKKLGSVLSNEEIRTIIHILGTGVGSDFDIANLQYDKVIICTDADDDGFHIRSLLTTLFWKLFPELVKQGHIYIANPPLFRFKTYRKGKSEVAFALNMAEYEAMKDDYKGWDVTRLKGLGEMDAKDLGKTTVRRGHRMLTQLTVEDAEKTAEAVGLWMNNNAQGRRDYITEHSEVFAKIAQEDSAV